LRSHRLILGLVQGKYWRELAQGPMCHRPS
jgi:hypothetical protein